MSKSIDEQRQARSVLCAAAMAAVDKSIVTIDGEIETWTVPRRIARDLRAAERTYREMMHGASSALSEDEKSVELETFAEIAARVFDTAFPPVPTATEVHVDPQQLIIMRTQEPALEYQRTDVPQRTPLNDHLLNSELQRRRGNPKYRR